MTCRIRIEAAGNVITVDDLAWRRKKGRLGVGPRRRRSGALTRPIVAPRLEDGEPQPAS